MMMLAARMNMWTSDQRFLGYTNVANYRRDHSAAEVCEKLAPYLTKLRENGR
jgi:hypothetical protein